MPDKLLYAISTLGNLPLYKYYKIYDNLYSPGTATGIEKDSDYTKLRLYFLRLLSALGHCEWDSRSVFVCPPTLVLLPTSGLPKAVLTGARTPKLIKKLEKFQREKKNEVFILQVEQSNGKVVLPRAIYIEAINTRHLVEIASAANINYSLEVPAAWSLVNFSSGTEDIFNSLVFTKWYEPRWKKLSFSPEDLLFKQYYEPPAEGLKLAAYKDPVSQQLQYWIWDRDTAAYVNREWGQQLVLANQNIRVLIYDKRHHRLALPSTSPLPTLLARAATLCTGLAPHTICIEEKVGDIRPGIILDMYGGITPPLAEVVSKKLGQKLVYKNLTN
jgi:hypothetical protein